MPHGWIVNTLLSERSQTLGIENRSVFLRGWGERLLFTNSSDGYTTLGICQNSRLYTKYRKLCYLYFISLHTILRWSRGQLSIYIICINIYEMINKKYFKRWENWENQGHMENQFFYMTGCISCQNITFKDLGITHQRFSSSKPTGILQVIWCSWGWDRPWKITPFEDKTWLLKTSWPNLPPLQPLINWVTLSKWVNLPNP